MIDVIINNSSLVKNSQDNNIGGYALTCTNCVSTIMNSTKYDQLPGKNFLMMISSRLMMIKFWQSLNKILAYTFTFYTIEKKNL